MDYQHRENDQLMVAYYEGDDCAFSVLQERFYGRLVTYFRGSLPLDDAYDMALETFVRVARTRLPERSAGRFGCGRCSFQTWLWSIARNLMYDHLRRERREPEVIPIDPELPGEEGLMIEQLPSHELSPQERLEAQLFEETVKACLAELDPLHREAATFLLEGLSLQEVAQIGGIPYGTAGSRRSNALRRLRSCLEAKGFRPN